MLARLVAAAGAIVALGVPHAPRFGELAGGGAPAPMPFCVTSHAALECLRPLDAAENAALVRTIDVFTDSRDAVCRDVGAFMRAHAHQARVTPYTIQTPYGPATGDAHPREQPAGAGRVHVADSVFAAGVALARPMEAKIHTLVHDYAHLAMELPQFHVFLGGDPASDVAARCLGD